MSLLSVPLERDRHQMDRILYPGQALGSLPVLSSSPIGDDRPGSAFTISSRDTSIPRREEPALRDRIPRYLPWSFIRPAPMVNGVIARDLHLSPDMVATFHYPSEEQPPPAAPPVGHVPSPIAPEPPRDPEVEPEVPPPPPPPDAPRRQLARDRQNINRAPQARLPHPRNPVALNQQNQNRPVRPRPPIPPNQTPRGLRENNAERRLLPGAAVSPLTCLICTEPIPRSAAQGTVLPCGHAHCLDCLAAGTRISIRTMPFTPVRCCQPIEMSTIRRNPKVTPDEIDMYRKKLSEFNEQRPLYCADPKCSAFIPSALRSKSSGRCRKCHRKTCVICHSAYHSGPCPTIDFDEMESALPGDSSIRAARGAISREEMRRRREEDLRRHEQQFRILAAKRGWKPCPKCRTMVEKIDGCNHIHCTTCSTHFCYRCGRAPYDNHGECAM